MAGLIFLDVDTQHDFMHADGKLYVPESESIIHFTSSQTRPNRSEALRMRGGVSVQGSASA